MSQWLTHTIDCPSHIVTLFVSRSSSTRSIVIRSMTDRCTRLRSMERVYPKETRWARKTYDRSLFPLVRRSYVTPHSFSVLSVSLSVSLSVRPEGGRETVRRMMMMGASLWPNLTFTDSHSSFIWSYLLDWHGFTLGLENTVGLVPSHSVFALHLLVSLHPTRTRRGREG